MGIQKKKKRWNLKISSSPTPNFFFFKGWGGGMTRTLCIFAFEQRRLVFCRVFPASRLTPKASKLILNLEFDLKMILKRN